MESGIFSKSKNYNENYKAPVTTNRIIINTKPQVDSIPDLATLPDGDYKGRWYGYTFELENGAKYKTKTGARQKRQYSSVKTYTVKDGQLSVKSFSGMAEVGAGMQGMSYGKVDKIIDNPTRVSIDQAGFKIPDKIVMDLNIKTNPPKEKTFSKDGIFTGGSNNSQPTIRISNDNSIIRNATDKSSAELNSNSMDYRSKATSVIYDPKKPFNLSIEPWVVSPLMSDTAEGIYVGKLLGDKITSGIANLMLSVKLNKQTPEDVVVFVRDGKAYVFTIAQLAHQSVIRSAVFSDKCPADGCVQPDGDKWMIISNKTGAPWKPRYETKEKAENALKAYHANRHFSDTLDLDPTKIENDKEFRDYAHNLMKKAHKDNYSKEKTDKVVDDLLAKHEGKDYGELIGRLRSGLGTKSFADPVDPNSPANPARPSMGVTPTSFVSPGGQVANVPQSPDPAQAQPGDPSQPVPQVNPTVTVSGTDVDPGYSFQYTVSTASENTMDYVIGNLIYSISFVHLFHLCTREDVVHRALDKYYKEMPKKVDELAEAYLQGVSTATFKLSVVPTSGDPVEYLQQLKEFLQSYIQDKEAEPQFKEFNTYFDEIMKLINSTLYPMKRLKEGKKAFSLSEEVQVYSNSQLDDLRDTIIESAKAYEKNSNKRAFPEIPRGDGRKMKQYVKDRTLTNEDAIDFLNTFLRSITGGVNHIYHKVK